MTLFRPCIDLHEGRVKQIVGSSLVDKGNRARENFVSDRSAGWYAELYRNDRLTGGHLIKLGPGNDAAAREALAAWPGGLQVGGGITGDNAQEWIDGGASKVIVTSWLFVDGELSWERLQQLSEKIGRDRLVVDLSCRKGETGWFVAADRWQTLTRTEISAETLCRAAEWCSEFLVHAVNAEGLQAGVDEELIRLLADASPIPVTYAGGARSDRDLETVDRLSDGKVDLTIGSALDLFGGTGASYEKCVEWNGDRDFGEPFSVRHVGSDRPLAMIWGWFREFIRHLPAMIRLRSHYKRLPPSPELRVALFSDNLDEVNGIAISARLLVRTLREKGHNVRLLGIGYYTREGRGLIEPDGTVLFPQVFSMEQVGYEESELAIPSVREMIRWFRRHPVDLLEIETPSSGGMLALILGKIAGIKVFSHYRTDITAYLTALASDRPLIGIFTRTWVKLFSRLSTPVIVPSTHFETKMREEIGLRPHQIALLPRGAGLENYSPARASENLWKNYFEERGAIRFVYVGRVSEEKELPFLEEVWREWSTDYPDAQLLIVGKGPYLERMKRRTADLSSIRYTGVQRGVALAALYAEADWFLFPSGTDTFGNVVVESLASGTPALVSDSGGPRDIVEEGRSGRIVPFRDRAAWIGALTRAEESLRNGEHARMREEAVTRSAHFSLENSADAFWKFYLRVAGS